MARDFSGAIDARELLALSARLKNVAEGKAVRRAVSSVNREAVAVVLAAARAKASTPQERAVADDPAALRGSANADRAVIQLIEDPRAGKNDPRRFAFGAEFGAKPNIERTVGVRKIAIGKRGKRNIFARDYKNAHTMLGWNQFQPWRGSARVEVEGVEPGYFLWPAVRDSRPLLEETVYGPRAEAIIAAAIDNPIH